MRGLPTRATPLRVVVAGDDALVETLSTLPERLIVTAATAHLDVSVRTAQANAVLLDTRLAPLERMRELKVELPVLVLCERHEVLPAIAAGASGALRRNASAEEIAAALVGLDEGLAVFDRAFVQTVVSTPPEGPLPPVDEPELPVSVAAESAERLTAREREVIGLLAAGLSNKDIARQLGISEHTAKFHVNSILQKFGAQKRVEAVVRAARLGLIEISISAVLPGRSRVSRPPDHSGDSGTPACSVALHPSGNTRRRGAHMAIPGSELSQTLARVVEETGRSVVRVDGGRRRSLSGIAWSAHEVLTANHGVQQDEALVGTGEAELKAKVKGRDPTRDLALLEVDGALAPASFSDGAGLKVGHLVLQLARPGESVRATSGIVSVLGQKPWRTWRGGEIDRWLESDAPHQPGFSGGPLVGLDGKVLGLVSTGLLRGTSVAVPSSTLTKVVEQLQKHGRVRQGYLGLSMQPVQLPEEVKQSTGEEIGLLVIGVEKGGPAEQAGIVYGDTLLHLGDDGVKTLEDLYTFLRGDHVGEKVPARLWRNGKVETLQVTLGAKP